MIFLVALLAFAAGWLAGWICASEYHWRFERKMSGETDDERDWKDDLAGAEWPAVRRDEPL